MDVRRLAALILPAGIVAAIGTGLYYLSGGVTYGGGTVWSAVWPFVVALAALAAGGIVYLLNLRRYWLWLPGIAFAVQLAGSILNAVYRWGRGWSVLLYTVLALLVAVLVMGGVYFGNRFRKRPEGVGLGQDLAKVIAENQEELRRIRENIEEAVRLIHRAGGDVYSVPWVLTIGRMGGGKTKLIKTSEIRGRQDDWAKGRGGTYTADFFFTNEIIFIDTPGEWVSEGNKLNYEVKWRQIFALLQKYRKERPIEGLVVVAPYDLRGLSEEELRVEASRIREVIDLAQRVLDAHFPVYLVVTKVDLISGFEEFFFSLPANRRYEVFGWSNSSPEAQEHPAALVTQALQDVSQRIRELRPELLVRQKERGRRQTLRMFLFPENLAAFEEKLTAFAEELLAASVAGQEKPPLLRGIYFTSSERKGTPISEAIEKMRRRFGLHTVPADTADDGDVAEPRRSLFVRDLFREVVIKDEGLAGRSIRGKIRLNRNRALLVFAPAIVAAALLTWAGLSLWANKALYRAIASDAPKLAKTLRQATNDFSPTGRDASSTLGAIEATGRVKEYLEQVRGPAPFRAGIGMRRAAGLETELREFLVDSFSDAVLTPSLGASANRAVGDGPCTERFLLFADAVWLGLGGEGAVEELRKFTAFSVVWGKQSNASLIPQARESLLEQFAYLARIDPNLVPLAGANLKSIADDLVESCRKAVSASPTDLYRAFSKSCGKLTEENELSCPEALEKLGLSADEDYVALRSVVRALRSDLGTLSNNPGPEQREAEQARAALALLEPRDEDDDPCLETFRDVARAIKVLVDGSDPEGCLRSTATSDDRNRAIDEWIERLKSELEEDPDYQRGVNKNEEELAANCRGMKVKWKIVEDVWKRGMYLQCHNDVAVRTPEEIERRRRKDVAVGPPVVTPKLTYLRALSLPYELYSQAGVSGELASWDKARAQIASSQSATIRTRDQASLEARVASYTEGFVAAWRTYLGGLRVAIPTQISRGWFRLLGESGDFGDALSPAVSAIEAVPANPETGSPQSRFRARVADAQLSQVPRLVGSDLDEYLGELVRLGTEIEGADAVRLEEMRRNLESTLRNLRIRANRLGNVAGGISRELWQRPVEVLGSYLTSSATAPTVQGNVQNLWEQAYTKYAALQGYFPLTADGDLPSGRDLTDLATWLGSEIPALDSATAGAALSTEARDFLSQARTASNLMFHGGTVQPLLLNVRIASIKSDPAKIKLGDDIKVAAVRIVLGPGSSAIWTETDATERTVRIDLVGEAAARQAVVEADISLDKTWFKGKWEPPTSFRAHEEKGAGAPLTLLLEGTRNAASPRGQSMAMRFTVPFTYKDKPASIVVDATVSGTLLPEALQFASQHIRLMPQTPF